jgi:serine/threonine protein kinase
MTGTPSSITERPPLALTTSDQAELTTRYEILDEAGRGGMGIVYRARHRLLGRQVALKVCLPGGETERFRREAQLLAGLRSAHVVTVHDFELLPDGRALLVMDWIAGRDLGQLLRAQPGPLPETRALPWMRHVGEGMAAAAEQGIVHRDLKPSNILLDELDQARVADFGLARTEQDTALTMIGGVMGTPYYMAPEQAEDPRGVDTRADVYSFGATFYHVLTGAPPFEGATTFSILYKHKTEPLVSPRARNSGLTERTSEILERCLAKAPSDRFASFAELLRQLQPADLATSPWLASEDADLAAYMAGYQTRRSFYLSEREAWNQELDRYTFPRGQVLRIMRGDIVAQQVDALVSSDNGWLSMDYGVSQAIRRAAGPEVAAQAARLAPVRPGRTVVTSGGKLAARFVFHGVTMGKIEDQLVRPSRDLIAEIMASCFYHADTHGVHSLAFPLLGTGAQRFPRDICLDTMFQFLARMFLRGLTSVRDARIVLFD